MITLLEIWKIVVQWEYGKGYFEKFVKFIENRAKEKSMSELVCC